MACDYRELLVWQEAKLVAQAAYSIVKGFPSGERFGLASQLRRPAVTVVSCIAQGNARNSTRGYLRFPAMFSGSLAEVEKQMLLAEHLEHTASGDAGSSLNSLPAVLRHVHSREKAVTRKIAENTQFSIPRRGTSGRLPPGQLGCFPE